MNVPPAFVLALSGILFALGVIGVLIRRNAIVIFMSIELMLNAANLALIASARMLGPALEALRRARGRRRAGTPDLKAACAVR